MVRERPELISSTNRRSDGTMVMSWGSRVLFKTGQGYWNAACERSYLGLELGTNG